MLTNTAVELIKTAKILHHYDNTDIDYADGLSDDTLDKEIHRKIRAKAIDTPTSRLRATLTGGVIGAIPGALMGVSNGGGLPGAAFGAAVGGGLGALSGLGYRQGDINAIQRANTDIINFTSPTFRERLRAKARGRARNAGMEEAHYNALSRNDRMRQLHSDVYGGQYYR